MERQKLAQKLTKFIRSQFATDGQIPLHAPVFAGRERERVIEAIDSTYVSSVGACVGLFERQVAHYTESPHAIATVNGTAALHIALLLAGVQARDEVLTQPLTFVATCNAIRYCNAEPVFVDVDRDTLGLSPDHLEGFLAACCELRDDGLCWNRHTGRVVRACLPMHSLGHPVRIREIADICRRYNLVLVEDAAESLGGFYQEVHTGRFGRLAILSFNGNKIITTGGGGMILTADEGLARRARHLTTTAKQPHPWLFLHDEVGYNYRMPNLNAALGCAQLEMLSVFLEKKRELAARYAQWLQERDYVCITEPPRATSNYWLNAFLAADSAERDAVLEYTNSHQVMTRPLWTPMHRLEIYCHCFRGDLANAEWLADRLVAVPSSVILHQ